MAAVATKGRYMLAGCQDIVHAPLCYTMRSGLRKCILLTACLDNIWTASMELVPHMCHTRSVTHKSCLAVPLALYCGLWQLHPASNCAWVMPGTRRSGVGGGLGQTCIDEGLGVFTRYCFCFPQ
jgi:hypothetical protein